MNEGEEGGGGIEGSPTAKRRRFKSPKPKGRPKTKPVFRPKKKPKLAPRPAASVSNEALSMSSEQTEVLDEHQTPTPPPDTQYGASAARQHAAWETDIGGYVSQPVMHHLADSLGQFDMTYDPIGSVSYLEGSGRGFLGEAQYHHVDDQPNHLYPGQMSDVSNNSQSFPITGTKLPSQWFSPLVAPKERDREGVVDVNIILYPDEAGNSRACEFYDVPVSEKVRASVMTRDTANALQVPIRELGSPRHIYSSKSGRTKYRECADIVYQFPSCYEVDGGPPRCNKIRVLIAPDEQATNAPPFSIGRDLIDQNVYKEEVLCAWDRGYVQPWMEVRGLTWGHLFFGP